MAVDNKPVEFEDILVAELDSLNNRREFLHRKPVEWEKPGQTICTAVGLSLSGGGIRSAAVSLGALQALDRYRLIDRIDYLSTVSGGGYIGASVTATMTETRGTFVYGERAAETLVNPGRYLAHLRNYSNYLLAGGRQNLGSAVAIVVRGLIVNLAIVTPVLLYLSAAWMLILYSVDMTDIGRDWGFAGTTSLLVIGFILFLLWALVLSFRPQLLLSEEGSTLPTIASIYLIIIALAFFVELQYPLTLSAMKLYFRVQDDRALNIYDYILRLLHTVAAVGVPIGLATVLFQRQFGTALLRHGAISAAARIAFVIAAIELPLVIWIAFLHLSALGYFRAIDEFRSVGPVVVAYVVLATILVLFAILLKPNAVSLHGLYRDRLRKAFLQDLRSPAPVESSGYMMPATHFMRVSDISPIHAPYHLINAALNIRGSSYANQRGRDADFFVFSPHYVGSSVTGYVSTVNFEKAQKSFDLATAIAISGAAVSSSMGKNSIRLFAPTLALLNIRLGYWLRNPRRLFETSSWTTRVTRSFHFLWSEMRGRLYTDTSDEVYVTDGGHIENLGLYELLRRRCQFIICIDAEADPEMRFSSFLAAQRYASIDLGIQIDLPWQSVQATTVEWMGYDPLAAKHKERKPAAQGPHAAIGTISYPSGETGFLLYLKSSLSGDERDYILDYARRHKTFPHEPTGKQFFNEEQFEVYRALGNHIVQGVLSGIDVVVSIGPDSTPVLSKFDPGSGPAIKAVYDALLKSV